jgi:hypothetical protein
MVFGRVQIPVKLGLKLQASRAQVYVSIPFISRLLNTHLVLPGTYIPDPSDSTGYNSDKIGIAWVTFDSTSGTSGTATPRIFVGVASVGTSNVWVSNDAGSTCE